MRDSVSNALGNRSHAVRAQRSESHDSLDDFPTPAWATRALCHHVLDGLASHYDVCWEPACNRGAMVKPLAEFFSRVDASDVHDYGFGFDPMRGKPCRSGQGQERGRQSRPGGLDWF